VIPSQTHALPRGEVCGVHDSPDSATEFASCDRQDHRAIRQAARPDAGENRAGARTLAADELGGGVVAAVSGLVLVPAELLGPNGDGPRHDVAVRLVARSLAAVPTTRETDDEPEGQEQGDDRSHSVARCRLAHERILARWSEGRIPDLSRSAWPEAAQ